MAGYLVIHFLEFKYAKEIGGSFCVVRIVFLLSIIMEYSFFDFMGTSYDLSSSTWILLILWLLLTAVWVRILWLNKGISYKRCACFMVVVCVYLLGFRGLKYSWEIDHIQPMWLGVPIGQVVNFGDVDKYPICYHKSFWFLYIENKNASFKHFKGIWPLNYSKKGIFAEGAFESCSLQELK